MHVFGHWAYWQNPWEFKGRQQEVINAMCLFNLALECVCVVHVHVCACMWRPQVKVRCHYSVTIYLVF